MAADEELAGRVRDGLADQDGMTEQRMFGGLAFLVDGNMAVAVSGEGGLMVRHDPDDADELLAEPGAAPMEMRGRPMRGWLRVDEEALTDDDVLARWIDVGTTFARTLPAT